MNTLHRTRKYYVLVPLAVVALVISCTNHPQTPGATSKVEIKKDQIIIHPTITLSKDDDEQRLNAILNRYDKKLYRVETWVNGKITKVEGTARVVKEVSAENGMARSAGAGHHAHDFVCPDAKCPDIRVAEPNEKKMLKELTPILEKYR